jgi:hypothetical protein
VAGDRLDNYIDEEIPSMNERSSNEVPRDASRDSLAAGAIAIVAIAPNVCVIIQL